MLTETEQNSAAKQYSGNINAACMQKSAWMQ